MKKKLETQNLILILLVAVILAGVGIAANLAMSAMDEKASLNEVNVVLTEKQAELSALQALDSQYDTLLAEYESALPSIPDEPGEEDIIRALQTATKAYGCSLTRVSFQDRVADASVQRMDISVNITGSYEQIANFALNLDQLARYFRLDSIVINNTGSDQALSATLDISAFYTV